MTSDPTPEQVLREAGQRGDAPLDIAGAALALAALDRTGVSLKRYREDLAAMVDAVAKRRSALLPAADAVAHAGCLGGVLSEQLSYRGDSATYDDLQNANLMRVMDRRKGLPVALGILYIHAARGQQWLADGLNTPGHFLIRVVVDGTALVLDPFNGGQIVDAAAMRDLISDATGGRGALTPNATRPVPDRSVLLRLQNNIKLRLIRDDRIREALAVIDRMRLLAPEDGGLMRECGLVNAHLGNLVAAKDLFERFLEEKAGPPEQRHDVALLLQRLRTRLH